MKHARSAPSLLRNLTGGRMDSARVSIPLPPPTHTASASSLHSKDTGQARAAAASRPPFIPPPRFPVYRQAPKPKSAELGRVYHRPPPPVVTLADELKKDPMPLPADRMTMHRVGLQLVRIQGSIAFPLRERLDGNLGYQNLSTVRKAELRELLAINPELYNHAKYYTWTSRHVREMVDDIKLAGQPSVVKHIL